MSNIVSRMSRTLAVSVIVSVMLGTAGATLAFQPVAAQDAGCDKANIVNCGIDGTDLNGHVTSFKAIYTKGTDSGNNDIKAVYQWAGVSDADVENMNATNTKMGVVHRNGQITVGDEVVASDAWVTARFTNGDGFTKVSDGVWARKTTTSFEKDSRNVIVHYDANNQVDWAVILDCGNAVKVTPVKKTKPVLTCTGLNAVKSGTDDRTYTFTVTATAAGATIRGYAFNFGDGTTEIVPSTDTSATATHAFSGDNQTYKITAAINSGTNETVTSEACATTITTPGEKPAECKPGIPIGSPECEEAPAELPNAGAGAIAGLFAGTSALGAGIHRVISRRRSSRES